MKKMKMYFMVLVMSIFFCVFPQKVLASGLNSQQYDFVSTALEEYYKNKDIKENNDLTKFYSKDSLLLLNAKIKMEEYQQEVYDLKYENYAIKISEYEKENWNNNTIVCCMQVERTWKYSSVTTDISELVNVTLKQENNNLEIISVCNKYDDAMYGPIDELYYENINSRSKGNMKVFLNDYVNQYKEECIEKNNSYNDQKNNKEEKSEDERSNISLSRNNIRDWARRNYNATSPTSSTTSVPYYDFSNISGAYDCTNFVSHALLAGGATRYDKGKNGIQGVDQWYFRNTANRSSSWSGVNELYSFLTRSNPSDTSKGPFAVTKELSYTNAYVGDIVQGYNGSIWRHSTVVTRNENQKVYVTGRTAPGVYNDNQLAITIYSKQRLLHISGNYTG